ncbi:DUF7581 domain-containing protein, partial [Streptomyces sp. JAC128]|uniref:CT398-like coiled coil hairpin domain-containing protein n=1 Tax=Streptomyces sp. JAC128 TaxID=3418412 RepID=UPI003D81502A
VQAKVDDATARRDAATQELDADAALLGAQLVVELQQVVAGAVPADLLKLYDKLRAQPGGVGAARLYQRRCEGCRPGG